MLLPMKADRRVQRVQGQPWSGILVSPSFLWKEVPRRGGGWLSLRTKRHVRCFPCPLSSQRFSDRKRKRFLAFARNDNMGKAAFSYLPPSSGRRCPEGAEVGSRRKKWVEAFPRFSRNDDAGVTTRSKSPVTSHSFLLRSLLRCDRGSLFPARSLLPQWPA